MSDVCVLKSYKERHGSILKVTERSLSCLCISEVDEIPHQTLHVSYILGSGKVCRQEGDKWWGPILTLKNNYLLDNG